MADADEQKKARAAAIYAPAGQIRRLLERAFTLGAEDVDGTLKGPPSVTGRQLEAIRSGLMGPSDAWRRMHASEETAIRHMLVVKLWRDAEHASPLGAALLRLQMTPIGWEYRERVVRTAELLDPADVVKRQHGLCLEPKRSGGLCHNPLHVGEDGVPWLTCKEHEERMGDLRPGKVTSKGEVWLRKAKDDDFPPGFTGDPEGYDVVQGRRTVYPTAKVIAEVLAAEWDDEAEMARKPETPGRPTGERRQLENAAESARLRLAAAGYSAARARGELHLRGYVVDEGNRADGKDEPRMVLDARDERKVRYAVEKVMDQLREGSVLPALLGDEDGGDE